MSRLRLGVALLIPPPVDREIDALRRALGDPGRGRVPSHLTLVPPVNVAQDRYDDALAVLAEAAAATRPFTVALGAPATFLPDSPTLYLPAAPAALPAIEAIRERVFRDPLQRPPAWPFVPHVTIADEIPPARIDAAIVALAGYGAEVTFERLHLLRENGGVWRPVAEAVFGRATGPGRPRGGA